MAAAMDRASRCLRAAGTMWPSSNYGPTSATRPTFVDFLTTGVANLAQTRATGVACCRVMLAPRARGGGR